MKKNTGLYLLVSCIIATFMIISLATVQASNETTVDMLVYNWFGSPYYNNPWGAHEGIPHGVPSDWSWYNGASGWGGFGSNQAMTTWGHCYEWAGESPVTNIRIHIRNMKTYGYYNGQWNIIEQASNDIGGSYWTETYSGGGTQGDVRVEADGGISFTMPANTIYHWWSPVWPRPYIPTNAQAFYTTLEFRVIPNTDPNVDLNNAKYLVSQTWDWYTTPTSSGPGPWPSVGVPRFRWVKPYWQTLGSWVPGFFASPASADQFRSWITSLPLPPGVTDGGGGAPPTPPPGAWTMVDNNDANIAYSGNWGTYSDANAYGGSWRASNTNTNYAEYTFTGTGVRWISSKNTDHGIAEIRIDGVFQANVDTYASSHIWQQVCYEKTGLAYGTHTIRVTVTNTKNASSSGYWHDADAFAYTAEATVDDNNANIAYSGNWGTYSDANAYGGSWRATNASGRYAEFTFTGTGVRWISSKENNHGIAEIEIDGVFQANVDCYSPTKLWQQVCYEKTGLPYGTHTIRVTVTGTKNASATDYWHDVDAFSYYH